MSCLLTAIFVLRLALAAGCSSHFPLCWRAVAVAVVPAHLPPGLRSKVACTQQLLTGTTCPSCPWRFPAPQIRARLANAVAEEAGMRQRLEGLLQQKVSWITAGSLLDHWMDSGAACYLPNAAKVYTQPTTSSIMHGLRAPLLVLNCRWRLTSRPATTT